MWELLLINGFPCKDDYMLAGVIITGGPQFLFEETYVYIHIFIFFL